MLSLIQLAVNSLNPRELRRIINGFITQSEKIYNKLWNSGNIVFIREIHDVLFVYELLSDQNFGSINVYVVEDHNINSTNYITDDEIIDYAHQIVQMGDYLLQRIEETHTEPTCGYLNHMKVLNYRRLFNKIANTINTFYNDKYELQSYEQCGPISVDHHFPENISELLTNFDTNFEKQPESKSLVGAHPQPDPLIRAVEPEKSTMEFFEISTPQLANQYDCFENHQSTIERNKNIVDEFESTPPANSKQKNS